MGITKLATKLVGDKRRWRTYKARARRLPEPYRTSVQAIERYVMYLGPGDGDHLMTMLEDLADLFEQAAADATPLRNLVGENPVEFVEVFLGNYPDGQWRNTERSRLVTAIAEAAAAAAEEGSR